MTLNRLCSILSGLCFFDFAAKGRPKEWEQDAHQRVLLMTSQNEYPQDVWLVQGSQRVLQVDPLLKKIGKVTLHLISQSRYRPSQLFLWDSGSGVERRFDVTSYDTLGPLFELERKGQDQSFFTFKFIGNGEGGSFSEFEPDYANRLWVADDGEEVWMHSQASEIVSYEPKKAVLRMNFSQQLKSQPHCASGKRIRNSTHSPSATAR